MVNIMTGLEKEIKYWQTVFEEMEENDEQDDTKIDRVLDTLDMLYAKRSMQTNAYVNSF